MATWETETHSYQGETYVSYFLYIDLTRPSTIGIIDNNGNAGDTPFLHPQYAEWRQESNNWSLAFTFYSGGVHAVYVQNVFFNNDFSTRTNIIAIALSSGPGALAGRSEYLVPGPSLSWTAINDEPISSYDGHVSNDYTQRTSRGIVTPTTAGSSFSAGFNIPLRVSDPDEYLTKGRLMVPASLATYSALSGILSFNPILHDAIRINYVVKTSIPTASIDTPEFQTIHVFMLGFLNQTVQGPVDFTATDPDNPSNTIYVANLSIDFFSKGDTMPGVAFFEQAGWIDFGGFPHTTGSEVKTRCVDPQSRLVPSPYNIPTDTNKILPGGFIP